MKHLKAMRPVCEYTEIRIGFEEPVVVDLPDVLKHYKNVSVYVPIAEKEDYEKLDMEVRKSISALPIANILHVRQLTNLQADDLVLCRSAANDNPSGLYLHSPAIAELSELTRFIPNIELITALQTTAYGNHNMHWCYDYELDNAIKTEGDFVYHMQKRIKEMEEEEKKGKSSYNNYTPIFQAKIMNRKMALIHENDSEGGGNPMLWAEEQDINKIIRNEEILESIRNTILAAPEKPWWDRIAGLTEAFLDICAKRYLENYCPGVSIENIQIHSDGTRMSDVEDAGFGLQYKSAIMMHSRNHFCGK